VDFAYTVWDLRNSKDPLRNIPHANGGVHANWRISKRAGIRGDAQIVSRRNDFQIPLPRETTVGGYTNVNLSADYMLNQTVSLYARGGNILNSGFHEYIGFPNPGISVRFGVIYHVLAKP